MSIEDHEDPVDDRPALVELSIDRQTLEDTIERFFPCPEGANRVDWSTRIVDCAYEVMSLIEKFSWPSAEDFL